MSKKVILLPSLLSVKLAWQLRFDYPLFVLVVPLFFVSSSHFQITFESWITSAGMLIGVLKKQVFLRTFSYADDRPISYRQEEEYFTSPRRGADGRFTPVEQVRPIDEQFIGGFLPPPSPGPPPLPAKDDVYNDPTFRLPDEIKSQKSISSSQLSRLSAVERSRILRVARMEPHLMVSMYIHY